MLIYKKWACEKKSVKITLPNVKLKLTREGKKMTRRKRDPKKQELVSEYGVESIADIQNALKDLLGGTIEELLQAEINNHLGYEKYGHGDKENYRNGYKEKKFKVIMAT